MSGSPSRALTRGPRRSSGKARRVLEQAGVKEGYALVWGPTTGEFLEALDDDDVLVTGLSLYQKTGDGSVPRPAELVKEQVEQVRRMGIHGYCLFVTKYLNEEIIAVLRDDLNAEPAVPYFR